MDGGGQERGGREVAGREEIVAGRVKDHGDERAGCARDERDAAQLVVVHALPLPGRGRRGLCRADTDLMTMRRPRWPGKGMGLAATARAISAFTPGSSRTAASPTRTRRTREPSPWSSPWGSKSRAPWRKNRF